MLSNLAISILDKERVETTLIKAKEVRRVVERLITYGKKGDLAARRMAARRINDKAVLRKLFAEIAPSFKDRNGGYVRIIKTRERKGDNALMAIIELVGIGGAETERKRRKQHKKTTGQAGPAAAKTQEAVDTTAAESDNTENTQKAAE
jgi:large subunit ribosomal protein L17